MKLNSLILSGSFYRLSNGLFLNLIINQVFVSRINSQQSFNMVFMDALVTTPLKKQSNTWQFTANSFIIISDTMHGVKYAPKACRHNDQLHSFYQSHLVQRNSKK